MEKWAIFEVDTNKGKRLAFNLSDEPIGMLIEDDLTYENAITRIQFHSSKIGVHVFDVLSERLLFY